MKNGALHGIRKTLIASFLAFGALLPSLATDAIRRGVYNEQWGYVVTSNHTVTIKTWLGGTNYISEVVVPGVIEGLPVTRIENWANWDLKPDPWVPDWRAEYIEPDPSNRELNCGRLVIDGKGNMVIGGAAFVDDTLHELVLRGVKEIESNHANDSGAFRRCKNLVRVIADDALEVIGGQAFYEDPKLECLVGATSLKRIGQKAFASDPKLKDVPVSGKLEYIEQEAFLDCTSITNVVFPNSLTGLAEHAFRGCDFIEEVTFGSGLKTITGANFNSKPRLRKITIPEGVEEIAGRAFEGCSALLEVVFPDSLKDPGYWSFMDCPAITNIVIGKNGGMAYVRDSVFSADKMLDLDTVTINGNGETVINGKGGAFNGFKMRHLVLNGVKTIEDTNSGGAFRNCTNLVSVVEDGALEHVGVWAFAGCTALTTVEGFRNVMSIGSEAFAGCTSLPTIGLAPTLGTIEGGAFRGCSSLCEVVIPDSVTNIGAWAFQDCTGLRSVSLGKGLGRIGEIIPENADDLDTVVIDGNGETVISANACPRRKMRHLVLMGVKSFDDGNGGGAFSSCTNLQTVVADESLARIGAWTFSGCTALTSVEGVTAVTSIGAHGFEGCTSLPELPDFPILADLGGNGAAFSGCTSMTNAVIPDTVTNMESWTFRDCTGLRSITLGKGWSPIVQNLVPQGAEDLDTIVIDGNGETVIAGNAFFRCKMRRLVMSGVKAINGSCKECPNLEDVVADEALETIGEETFRSCPKLRSVTGITGVKVIGKNAFGNYNLAYASPALTEIELPEGLETIGEYAFANCTNLTDVTVPDTVTNVGWRAWMQCHGLANFTFGAGLNPIPGGLFDWCEGTMDALAINGDGTTAIADNAFNGMKINRVVLNGVAKVGGSAFQNNAVLTEVYFDGDAPTVGANAFGGAAADCTAYVPYGSTGWSVDIPLSGKTDWNYDGIPGHTIKIAYVVETNTITYLGLEGAANTNVSTFTVRDLPLALGPVEREGYKFLGWTPWDGVIPAGTASNVTFTALWEEIVVPPPTPVNPDAPGVIVDPAPTEAEAAPVKAEDVTSALSYNGYLAKGEEIVGSVTVKVAKKGRVTATVQLPDGSKALKKFSYAGTLGADGPAELACKKNDGTMSVSIGAKALSGTVTQGGETYVINGRLGTKDALGAADSLLDKGVWSVALHTPSNGVPHALVNGYSVLAVTGAKKGKVKVAGFLADGTKVSVTAQGMVFDSCVIVPVNAALYKGKVGGFSLKLKIEGEKIEVGNVSDWTAVVDGGTVPVKWDAVYASAKSDIESGATFGLNAADIPFDGAVLASADGTRSTLPSGVKVDSVGGKWSLPKAGKVALVKGATAANDVDVMKFLENPSGLKLGYAAKTGTFKGSFALYQDATRNGKLKLKRVSATVNGVVVKGVGYGSAVIKKTGAMPVTVGR